MMLCSVRQADDKLFGYLDDALKTKYAGLTANNPESLLLNGIMIQVCASVINNDGHLVRQRGSLNNSTLRSLLLATARYVGLHCKVVERGFTIFNDFLIYQYYDTRQKPTILT